MTRRNYVIMCRYLSKVREDSQYIFCPTMFYFIRKKVKKRYIIREFSLAYLVINRIQVIIITKIVDNDCSIILITIQVVRELFNLIWIYHLSKSLCHYEYIIITFSYTFCWFFLIEIGIYYFVYLPQESNIKQNLLGQY